MWRNAVSKFISATVINAKNSLNRPMSAKPTAPTVTASTGSLKSFKKLFNRRKARGATPNGPKPSKTYSAMSHLQKQAASRPSTTKGIHTNAYLLAYVPPQSRIAKNAPHNESKHQPSKSFADMKKPAKKSPCADPKNPSAPNPCGQPKPASPPSKSPCEEIKKMETPCPEAKSPCSQPPTPCGQSSPPCDSSSLSPSAKNCCHHKDLVPPPSVLCQLKHFELKSDCSSFHMKAEGFECCK